MHNHNLVSISTQNRIQYSNSSISVHQLISDNNNYVNLYDVTKLGLYNELILVTQKLVLELYTTVIECKTLYSLCITHTTFPNALRPQLPMQLKQQCTQSNS